MKTEEYTTDDYVEDRLAVVGTLGASLVAVVQLSTASSYGVPLSVAAFCFAVSIPLLTLQVLLIEMEAKAKIRPLNWYNTATFVCGLLFSFAGFSALFWHIHLAAALAFGLLALAGMLIFGHHSAVLKTLKQSRTTQ